MLKRLALALGLLLLPSLAFAQSSFTAKDATSVTQTFKSIDCSSTICAISVPVDSTGASLTAVFGASPPASGLSIGVLNAAATQLAAPRLALNNNLGTLPIEPPVGTLACSSTCNGTDLMAATDISGYAGVSITLVISGTATIQFQGSNDNFATQTIPTFCDLSSQVGQNPVSQASVSGSYFCPKNFKTFRVRYTSYSSGTQTSYYSVQAVAPPFYGLAQLNAAGGLPISSVTLPVATLNSPSASSGVVAAVACVRDDTPGTTLTNLSFGHARCDLNRNQFVVGNIAGGVADAGNPLKIGGIYNTTFPTYSNGQRSELQSGSRGSVNTTLFLQDSVSPIGSITTPADGASNTSINALNVSGYNKIWNGTTWDRQPGNTAGSFTIASGSAATGVGITPGASGSAGSSLVLKAGAGNLYSAYATNLTATAGFLTVLNLTAAPADGAITPLACVPLPANGAASINFNPGPASIYSTGITAVVTSAVTCFTKTTGVITAFIGGAAL